MVAFPSQSGEVPRYWPSARHFTEAIQCPSVCFSKPLLRSTVPAVDRLGMPIVTSGQFAYVYKLKSTNGDGDFAVRCFRGYLGDRDQRYRAIQEQVRSSPVAYLSYFSYTPEGIMVGGKKYPILFMKWIEGPTLDLYLSEMLHRRAVLLHLADEWLRVVATLQTAGIAHGDLQHGNVIVEHGQLRLIDHDGIFVGAMRGWAASEIGHQHYQHPKRTAQHFDSNLDNFSSLVIYLSLLSLAERPSLWQEHHDENLLFTRADFNEPASSTLFTKIREIGTEHCRLADTLANAAAGSPTSVPNLLDLVQRSSRLPSWIVGPADLEAKTKTREVAQTEAPFERRTARWLSRQKKRKAPTIPTSLYSSTVQTIFGAPAPFAASPAQHSAAPGIRDPSEVAKNTFIFGKRFFRKYFLWWYWAVYILFGFVGLNVFSALLVAMVSVMIGCLIFGLIRALDEARKARLLSHGMQRPLGLTAAPPQRGAGSWQAVTPPLPVSTAPNPIDSLIGNRALGIYHLQNCHWVKYISSPNRVRFASPSEALGLGFKPCRICSPSS